MKPLKPYRLRRWRTDCGEFFTCARPGRTGDPTSKKSKVSDDLVHRWALGLLDLPGPSKAIVSLLGRKPGGTSEFSFYSFYGGFDVPSQCPGKLSFQQWLDRKLGEGPIVLHEHPTCDFQPIPSLTLNAVESNIYGLMSERRTVVLVDSGGEMRTGEVCRLMGAKESFGA